MNRWEVTTTTLRDAATKISGYQSDYQGEISRLKSEMIALNSDGCSGEANTEFQNSLTKFQQTLDEINEILGSYVHYLNTTATNYEDVEAAVKNAAKKLND